MKPVSLFLELVGLEVIGTSSSCSMIPIIAASIVFFRRRVPLKPRCQVVMQFERNFLLCTSTEAGLGPWVVTLIRGCRAGAAAWIFHIGTLGFIAGVATLVREVSNGYPTLG